MTGIFGSVCDWVAGLAKYLPYIEWLIDLCEEINKPKPGPEKKEIVLDGFLHVLDIFQVEGILRNALALAAEWVIDQIVAWKNETGEFTHGGE